MIGVPLDIFYYWAVTVPDDQLLMTAFDSSVELVAFSAPIINSLFLLIGQTYFNLTGLYYIAQYGLFFNKQTPWHLIVLNVINQVFKFITIPSIFLLPMYMLMVPNVLYAYYINDILQIL